MFLAALRSWYLHDTDPRPATEPSPVVVEEQAPVDADTPDD